MPETYLYNPVREGFSLYDEEQLEFLEAGNCVRFAKGPSVYTLKKAKGVNVLYVHGIATAPPLLEDGDDDIPELEADEPDAFLDVDIDTDTGKLDDDALDALYKHLFPEED